MARCSSPRTSRKLPRSTSAGEAAAIMMSGECCRAPLQATGRAGKHSAALALIASALTWCLRARGRRPEHLLPAPLQLSHARRGELAHPPWPWLYRYGAAMVSSRCSGTDAPPARALSRSTSSPKSTRYLADDVVDQPAGAVQHQTERRRQRPGHRLPRALPARPGPHPGRPGSARRSSPPPCGWQPHPVTCSNVAARPASACCSPAGSPAAGGHRVPGPDQLVHRRQRRRPGRRVGDQLQLLPQQPFRPGVAPGLPGPAAPRPARPAGPARPRPPGPPALASTSLIVRRPSHASRTPSSASVRVTG